MSDHRPYYGYSLSELRARAHAHRTYPDGGRWPPRGWTYHGLRHHQATVARACALLIAFTDPEHCDVAVRRAREAERRRLQEHLPDALRIALIAVGDDDTAPLDMRPGRKDEAS